MTITKDFKEAKVNPNKCVFGSHFATPELWMSSTVLCTGDTEKNHRDESFFIKIIVDENLLHNAQKSTKRNSRWKGHFGLKFAPNVGLICCPEKDHYCSFLY